MFHCVSNAIIFGLTFIMNCTNVFLRAFATFFLSDTSNIVKGLFLYQLYLQTKKIKVMYIFILRK